MPSGEARWINALGNTIYDEHGKAVRMSGICIDITELKKVQGSMIRTLASVVVDACIKIIDRKDFKFQ